MNWKSWRIGEGAFAQAPASETALEPFASKASVTSTEIGTSAPETTTVQPPSAEMASIFFCASSSCSALNFTRNCKLNAGGGLSSASIAAMATAACSSMTPTTRVTTLSVDCTRKG